MISQQTAPSGRSRGDHRQWNQVAAIGEQVRIEGYGLAGALTFPADEPEAVRVAWAALPGEVAVVILTPAAAQALHDVTGVPGRGPLTVVLPA